MPSENVACYVTLYRNSNNSENDFWACKHVCCDGRGDAQKGERFLELFKVLGVVLPF